MEAGKQVSDTGRQVYKPQGGSDMIMDKHPENHGMQTCSRNSRSGGVRRSKTEFQAVGQPYHHHYHYNLVNPHQRIFFSIDF